MARTKTTKRQPALSTQGKRYKDAFTQTGLRRSTYVARRAGKFFTFEKLYKEIICNDETTLNWCRQNKLIACDRVCPECGLPMKLKPTKDRRDGVVWLCRRRIRGSKEHRVEMSLRKGSIFEDSNLSLAEVIQFIYWWSLDVSQVQMRQQTGMSKDSVNTWHMKCREVCERALLNNPVKIGGPGKMVQIDESKIGKRKYNKGHLVTGQWVFGGIEDPGRGSFLVCVEQRSQAVLLPIIKKWIRPGTLIVSDCWKAYCNLHKHGYRHKTVNHSKEYKNSEGYHTNKIEGHWRQMKLSLPTHGRRKYNYPAYLAEFMYRYRHRESDLFHQFVIDVAEAYQIHPSC